MDINTHLLINRKLCGNPTDVGEGFARIEMRATDAMSADATGLVHGGFIFGMADYAAMLAVNDPNVVLGAAEVTFLKPVAVGEKMVAEARVSNQKGKKHIVEVAVQRSNEGVFKGVFTCFVLEKHVLSP
jgi:uncharacterized protein (TIGR00369 family)